MKYFDGQEKGAPVEKKKRHGSRTSRIVLDWRARGSMGRGAGSQNTSSSDCGDPDFRIDLKREPRLGKGEFQLRGRAGRLEGWRRGKENTGMV